MRFQYSGETGHTPKVGHLVKNGLYDSKFFPKDIKEEWLKSGKLTEYKEVKKKLYGEK